MITYSNLGKAGSGRLGNSLFQIASMIGMSERYGTDFTMPVGWKYYNFFKNLPDQGIMQKYDERIIEPQFHYTPDFFDAHHEKYKNKTIDILGWLQTEKYWIHCKDKVLNALKFKDDFRNNCRDRFSKAFDKKTIAISIRRGDFVNNPNHYLLPITYYILALFDNFPDWREKNIVIFSDDIPYCKVHFGGLDNVFFPEGFSDIEQLCLMTQMDDFIIANSTFSWWGAYLGSKKHSKIIRPVTHFRGELKQKSNINDHYPNEWIKFDHRETNGDKRKIDLSDVTFCIPICHDSEDRKQNLDINLFHLMSNFNTKFIVGEQKTKEYEYTKQWGTYKYYSTDDMPFFHRTKIINDLVKLAKTEIVVNWDTDMLIAPLQLHEAIRKIVIGKSDFVYPYDGRFARVSREWLQTIQEDVGYFGDNIFNGMQRGAQDSNGGAVIMHRQKYFEAGGENENMKNYAPEDKERKDRFSKLGFRIDRQKGVIYHLDHIKGDNSKDENEFFKNNWDELNKIREMDSDELRIYVNSWYQTWV